MYPYDAEPAYTTWPPPSPDETLERWQSGRCAMCGGRSASLVSDHDHTTGLTRGLLCRSCNGNEGMGNDHPAWIAWRAGCNPARAFSQEVEYAGIFGAPDRRQDHGWSVDALAAALESTSRLAGEMTACPCGGDRIGGGGCTCPPPF